MILRDYQAKAVDELAAHGIELLARPDHRQKLVFKAPTGAGKTVIMGAWLQRMAQELPGHYELPKRRLAYLWIAPNQLHEQSLLKLRQYYEATRTLRCLRFLDISDKTLHENEVFFVNWQSISRADALAIRASENDNHLAQVLENTRQQGLEIVVILDEAHLFATKGGKALKALELINAKIEIDVSATPLLHSDNQVVVRRPDVVKAEMIKMQVMLNPAVKDPGEGRSLNEYLLSEAFKKRQELEARYQSEGSPVRPLLLIQLPSENKVLSLADKQIRTMVEQWLDTVKNVNEANGKLAVWLSEDKSDALKGIEHFNSTVEVLLFKQAISLGWDCPRAAVLVIFREIKSETFTIQTVGRILRMPEHRHYHDNLLNQGYVYTNLSKNHITVQPDDMDYVMVQRGDRVSSYASLGIQTSHLNRSIKRNRLGSGFRKIFRGILQQQGWISVQQNVNHKALNIAHLWDWDLNASAINVVIPKDVYLTGEEQAVSIQSNVHYARTSRELASLLHRFCLQCVGDYAKVDSAPVLQFALVTALEEFLDEDETSAAKIILKNDARVQALIDQALLAYRGQLQEQYIRVLRNVERADWDVPLVRLYPEGQFKPEPTRRHVLQAFFESVNASNPEKRFVQFLEQNRPRLRWWYKNGDSGREHFAVPYAHVNGEKSLFYVDFIILLNDGTVCLFDTKSLGSDENAARKHNGLWEYLQELRQRYPERKFMGGIIIEDRKLWKFSRHQLADNFSNLDGWDEFIPASVLQSPDFVESEYWMDDWDG